MLSHSPQLCHPLRVDSKFESRPGSAAALCALEAAVGDVSCTRCPELMSTLTTGATSPDDCQCQAGVVWGDRGGGRGIRFGHMLTTCQVGLYADETGACVDCFLGF